MEFVGRFVLITSLILTSLPSNHGPTPNVPARTARCLNINMSAPHSLTEILKEVLLAISTPEIIYELQWGLSV